MKLFDWLGSPSRFDHLALLCLLSQPWVKVQIELAGFLLLVLDLVIVNNLNLRMVDR